MFENPCFENEDAKLKIAYRKRQNSSSLHHQQRSPKKFAYDVPVLAPKRRASVLFPNYLRRTDSINVQQNNQNTFKDQKFDDPNDKVTELMTAYSTRCLEPYNGINISEIPRIENYQSMSTNFNNDFINFSNALSKSARSTDFEPLCFKYDNEKTTGISNVKFGWFEGVFIRTSVNLLGVMLFMRMYVFLCFFFF